MAAADPPPPRTSNGVRPAGVRQPAFAGAAACHADEPVAFGYRLWQQHEHNPKGCGEPSTLSLTDANGALLATINMPPRRSFGIGASVTDAEGKPIAWLRTSEKTRPHGMMTSDYRIFASRPQTPGQQPTTMDDSGAAGYLVATVSCPPFTNKHTATDARGAEILVGRTHFMYCRHGMQTYTTEMRGAGACHISKTETKPPMHDIRVAQGADALLCVLVKLAAELSREEVEQNNNAGGGGP